MRIAAIDIGSYSVRLAVAELSGGRLKIVEEKGRITSLGSGVREEGRLREDRIRETLEVLRQYSEEIERLGVEKVVAVATEAIRRAENSEDFLRLVKEQTGIEVRIITPQEEGRLAFLGATYSLKPSGKVLVVDQGGGSTEFVFGEDSDPEEVVSLPIGIVNLTERFLRHDPPTEEEVQKLFEFLREEIAPLRREIGEVIGLGGTITTLAALEGDVYPYDPSRVHGKELSIKSISRWLSILLPMPSKERSRRFKQIEDRRAEVIVPGIAMFVVILEVFGKDGLRVSDWGLKHGLIVRELFRIIDRRE